MAVLALSGLVVGCSSGGSGGASPSPVGSAPQAVTKVTLVLSGDANDQLTTFSAGLQGITLTNSGGKSVTLLSQSVGTEFVHLNGLVEPVITGTVPQDTYTAATVSVGDAGFTCETLNSGGGVQDGTFVDNYVPVSSVSVSLPEPLVVTGDTLGLTLRMLVQKSASLSGCAAGATYAITPTFNLTSFDIAAAPAGSASTTVSSLEGEVTAVDGTSGSVVLQRPAYDGGTASTSLTVSVDGGTALQGIEGFAALAVGMFVNVDGAIQVDGSVHATRVTVADPTAVDVRSGPILSVFTGAPPVVWIKPIQGQGKDSLATTEPYDFSATSFAISGALSNVRQLPFAASFNAANMVPGQNVYLSSPAFVTCCGQPYFAPATTITLMPQTIDGTIFGISTSGGFTVYSVELTSNDLFVSLEYQAGQAALLTQSNQVQVYVDGSTRMQNSEPPVVGGTLRFYGLVFNDHGVLRMDCAQINDGIAVVQ